LLLRGVVEVAAESVLVAVPVGSELVLGLA
jgi:hypothetical protein